MTLCNDAPAGRKPPLGDDNDDDDNDTEESGLGLTSDEAVLVFVASVAAAAAALASYSPATRPINSDIQFRWNQGGRNVSSATSHRGGKITKSAMGPVVEHVDVADEGDEEVRTVNMLGSG